jgi:hypothetical protein
MWCFFQHLQAAVPEARARRVRKKIRRRMVVAMPRDIDVDADVGVV